MVQNLRKIAAESAAVLATLLGLVLVTFLIGRVMPVDPVLAIVGDKAPASVVAKVRLELGLDQPLLSQFGFYLERLLKGDLGVSTMTGQPVLADMLKYLPATLELATTAMIIALVVGVPLGVFAAYRQGSRFDNVVRVITLAGQSTPIFVMALVGLLIFYVKLDLVPGIGRQGLDFQGFTTSRTGLLLVDTLLDGQADAFFDALRHLALPALLLAYASMSVISRMTRAFMIEALSGEFIVTARAKGLTRSSILWGHAFPTVVGRLLSTIALTYGGLLEGAVLTETIFSWPGLGQYLTRSLLNGDLNAVLGTTTLIGVIYILLNILSDVGQYLFDPRVSRAK
ncbi:ABC transporter permease [Mesorhizobium sp. M0174]|uniref:ABC transporter permease n=1 Tax=Mesorhizobium sp. M0174 TaxID=2956904 RepID=UPI00333AEE36